MTKRRHGFSLVELMLAMAILGIIMAGLFYTLSFQKEEYITVDQVTEAQQNLRGVVDLIERDIRRAGYMVPASAAACAHDNTDAPDVLFLSEADAIRDADLLEDNNPDLLSGNQGIEVLSFGATSVRVASDSGGPILTIDDGAPGGLVEDGGIILVDRSDPDGRVACGIISAITGDTLTVNFGSSAYATSIGTDDVVAIPALAYRVIPAASDTPNQLTRNGLLIAYDVEDLQVAFFFDDDVDGNWDASSELYGTTGAAGTYPPPTSPGIDMNTLRELQLNVVTMTRDESPNQAGDFDSFKGQQTANRSTNLAPADNKPRRIHSATVRLRNLG